MESLLTLASPEADVSAQLLQTVWDPNSNAKINPVSSSAAAAQLTAALAAQPLPPVNPAMLPPLTNPLLSNPPLDPAVLALLQNQLSPLLYPSVPMPPLTLAQLYGLPPLLSPAAASALLQNAATRNNPLALNAATSSGNTLIPPSPITSVSNTPDIREDIRPATLQQLFAGALSSSTPIKVNPVAESSKTWQDSGYASKTDIDDSTLGVHPNDIVNNLTNASSTLESEALSPTEITTAANLSLQQQQIISAMAAQQQQNALAGAVGLPSLNLPSWSPSDGTEKQQHISAQRDGQSAIKDLFTMKDDVASVDMIAKMYRNGANYFDASCTWSGLIPTRHCKNPVYSPKVFLGGVPWDVTEDQLMDAFKQYGTLRTEFPNQRRDYGYGPKGTGYVYLIYDNEKSVKNLLQACTPDCSSGSRSSANEFYYQLSTKRMRSKEVQVIPWVVSDSQYIRQPQCRVENSRTIFVGALHGMISAEMLANIMHDLFGSVVSAQIDTDKHKYPIGSGRVVFHSQKSYYRAVAAAFVEVKTPKFTKKIQLDPYLEDSKCGFCQVREGPFFCRDCFKYYCRDCFWQRHVLEGMREHRPVTRNTRQATLFGTTWSQWEHYLQRYAVPDAGSAGLPTY